MSLPRAMSITISTQPGTNQGIQNLDYIKWEGLTIKKQKQKLHTREVNWLPKRDNGATTIIVEAPCKGTGGEKSKQKFLM